MTRKRVACIIPTQNGGNRFRELMESLERQVTRCDLLVVDSSSSDETAQVARAFGAIVETVRVTEFNHGGTRQMMVRRYPYDLYVFLTQDVLLHDEKAIAHLLAPFEDGRVGAVCGRQVAHEGASLLAEHARRFNYPTVSRTVEVGDAARLGIRAALMSNSFAAYRGAALEDVGGFPGHVIMAEDIFVAAKMLLKGWKVAYESSAICRHSHEYTVWEECRRYFDMGVFQTREGWIRQRLGGIGGEGLRYVASELRFLGVRRLAMWPSSLLRNALKLVGYELGKREALLPRWLKKRLSRHSGYWGVGT